MSDQQPIYLDEIHEDISTFAERHLEEDERAEFIDGLLERHGYVRESTWAPPPPPAGGAGGGGRRTVLPAKKAGGAKKQGGSGTYFRR